MITITTNQQIEDFTRGCCFFATGGGGDPLFGQKMLREALDAGKQICIIDAKELPDEAWTICPYLMGPAPGPESKEVIQARKNYGLTQELVSNMPAAATQLLLAHEKIKLNAVIPLELGAAATSSAVATAAWLGVPTIDGDYAGRALPEVAQILPAIHHVNLLPIASCDAYGNQVIIKKTTGLQMTERLGKIMATASLGLVGQAALLKQLKQIKSFMLFNTLSKALSVGSALREAREGKNHSLQSVINLTQAKTLFIGKVTKRKAAVQDGYYIGHVNIDGIDRFKGDKFKIWVKNESILSWLNDEPYIACPDLITMVDLSTFEPAIIGKLNEGSDVIVFGIPASESFRSPEALELLGPKHFGFDFKAKTLSEI
ncbi:Uncharacterized conserved protein [Legionella cincinnatiensis]|uniref:Uncharacterized conserved protein n=2 Tax=Legionella cincinnatiensis TaxID=28085 RepID=A0A378IJA1_9GAMM|nr:hypothetical protein Lcin_0221 [Legionella cincinnatiensis]STX35116.1 Uncharacterized conserved protein [Legionella cincinnatiensis]